MTGSELATAFSEVLDRPIRCEMLGPAELEERFKKGTVYVVDWYARSGFELLTQFADGRMGYMGTVKDDVPYLLGRPAIDVRAWAKMHKDQLLALVDQPSTWRITQPHELNKGLAPRVAEKNLKQCLEFADYYTRRWT
jgi:NAD(P)H dehydrogenase (quinone)